MVPGHAFWLGGHLSGVAFGGNRGLGSCFQLTELLAQASVVFDVLLVAFQQTAPVGMT
jgi:hypothetical protein